LRVLSTDPGFFYGPSFPRESAGDGRRAAPLPDTDVPTTLQEPKTAEGVRDLLAEAITQIRRRKLDTKVGNGLAYLAASLLRAIELSDLESRLRALEERNGGSNGN
jgi:hypothetical protein